MKKEVVEEVINEEKIINQIRCLGIDMIDNANSGHPGIVLGAAPIIYAIYAHHLNIDPKNPKYFNRDRFVMSAGHGSALLYATLYMAGYDLTLDDLKEAGSELKVKEKGKLRLEGKDYLVQDGDICYFRFNV